MPGKLIIYIGGIRSGKSELAEQRVLQAKAKGKVAYLATARVPAKGQDKALQDRLAKHQARRCADWETWDAWSELLPCLKKAARSPYKALLLDGLGMHCSRHLKTPQDVFLDDLEVFAKGCVNQVPLTVVVADEVGLGGVPGHAVARKFADLNGLANQLFAKYAHEVWFVVAGVATRVK
jgi:adenosylcobinamide kinase/adenosylcobinamide-phosphate guanylyltransferase